MVAAAPRVAVVAGDDAAPEVVEPAVNVVRATGAAIDWRHAPDDVMAAIEVIDDSDATLFGAAGSQSVPLLLHLRWTKGTFANVRPFRYLPGAASPLSDPRGIDFVIVRENLEDVYAGVEGPLDELGGLGRVQRDGQPVDAHEGSYALKIVTRVRVRQVAVHAFELARSRAAARDTGATVDLGVKDNVLPVSDGLFREVVDEVALDFPDVRLRTRYADDLARVVVSEPGNLDVVLLPNLYGDLISDVAAAVVGGLGLSPSGCYGEDFAYFEAVHGSAPDLAGRGVINPTAQILSAALLLDHVGYRREAAGIVAAVTDTYAATDRLTPDQGGSATTTELTDAIIERLPTPSTR